MANLTDADKVLRNDTGKSIVSVLETIADNTSWAGHTAGDLALGNTTPAGSTAAAIGDLSTLTTSVKSSLVGAVNKVDRDKADKTLINDIIKIKYFTLPAANVTQNMDISSNLVIDRGYKFLCYAPNVVPDGFTTDQYIWMSAPNGVQGRPWWGTNPIAGVGTSGKLRFYYFEIRTV